MSTYRAVIVDDEEFNFELFSRAAADMGCLEICCCVTNPYEALEKVREYGADIVFTDIEMPGLSGIELAERLIGENCVIVFLTAYSQYAVEAFRVNAVDYLMKPVSAQELERVMKKISIFLTHKSGERVIKDNVYFKFSGKGGVFCKGERLDIRFLTAKSEELFYILMLKWPDTVEKYRLCDILWPDTEPEKAAANLYTAFYRLKKTFSGMKGISFSGKSQGYSIVLSDDMEIDYHLISAAAKELYHGEDGSGRADKYLKITDSYSGSLLEGKGYLWLEPVRAEFDRIYIWASYQADDCLKGAGADTARLEVLEKLFGFFPYEEKACVRLCDLYMKKGDNILAVKTIQGHISALRDMLDLKPSPEIKKKLKNIIRDA
ncbi:response regulator [Lachnospiraceae bacterium NSJ-143]|nr:response regulator [Lachnospiraceae bacterium NSJ-143]